MRLLLSILLSTLPVLAANKYVRPGASGSQSGDDWTNAYTNLPSALTRGTIYYLADGTYPGQQRWNTANSGTSTIEFRKATASDHGTETGWSSTYGDGQALFNGYLEFCNDYWIVNGVSRTSMTNGHGIKIKATAVSDDMLAFGSLYYDQPAKHCVAQYIEIEGTHSSDDAYEDRLFRVPSLSGGSNDADDIYLGYSYVHHGGGTLAHIVSATNIVIEYTRFEYNDSSALQHSGGIIFNSGCVNATVRYCEFWDIEGTAYIETPTAGHPACAGPSSANWLIYGNLFGYTAANASRSTSAAFDEKRTGCGNGIIYLFDTAMSGEFKVYNNTIVNLNSTSGWGTPAAFIGMEVDSGSKACGPELVVRNNMWWNCNRVDAFTDTTAATNITWTHNTYFSVTTVNDSDGNKQTGSTNPFVDSSTDDYRLNVATAAGVTLSSPYTTDWQGDTRGGDGTWDRGWDEYGTGEGGGGSSSGSGKSKPGQGKGRRR
jgi:hypothetical protein